MTVWLEQKQTINFLCFVTCLVLIMSQESFGATLSLEQLTNILQEFNETLEADHLENYKLKSTISDLQAR